MLYDLIKVSLIKEGLALIVMNRPEKRNALNIKLMEEIISAFATLEKKSDVDVVILAAEGPIFSSGMDLHESQEMIHTEKMAQHVAKLLKTIYSSTLVTIAAVQGDAIAGGAGLVVACDFALMAESARIGFPETRRGLIAAQVSVLLTRQIRMRDVREVLLLGDLETSKRCLEIGIVNRVVAKEDVLSEAISVADSILKCAPEATRNTKAFLDKLSPRDFIHDLEFALSYHQTARASPEAQEGISAFLEKRDPLWKTKES